MLSAESSFCQSNKRDTANKLEIDSMALKQQAAVPHATFYFYRSFVPAINKSVLKIPIYINDTSVYQLKSNSLIPMQIFKEGNYTVAVDKKGNTDISVKVKFGKEYFFKCDLTGGFVIHKITIDEVTPADGRAESGVYQKF
jgi:hypothetical protein